MSDAAEPPKNDRERLKRLIQVPPEAIDWEAVLQIVESADPKQLVTKKYETTKKRKKYLNPIVSTLLHDIVPLNPPVEVVRAVASGINPHALGLSFGVDGGMALELACRVEASRDIIKTILEALCERQRHIDVLFIHVYWSYSLPLELLRLFLEEIPLQQMADMSESDANEVLSYLLFDCLDHEDFLDRLELIMMQLSMGTTRLEQLNGKAFFVLHEFLRLICQFWVFHDNQKPFLSIS